MQARIVEQAAAKVATLAPQEKPERTHLPLFTGGERTDKSPGDLADNETVQMVGLHTIAGRLVVDTGYVQFGGVYSGTAQGTFEVFFSDGSSVLLLFTTATVYQWVPSASQWQPVSLNQTHTVTLAAGSGVSAFSLNNITDLTVGEIVGITLDNGTQLVTTITVVGGSAIVTADPVPAGRSVLLNAVVTGGPALHGDPQVSQISAVVFPGNNWVIFSNGVDPVSYYLNGLVKSVPGLPSPTTCFAIAVFHSMLLLLNTIETGTHRPARVRASDAGDPTNWTTGISAIYDLLDTEDAILDAQPLGPWLIIYRDSSIMRSRYLGVLNEILFFEYMVQTEGVQSQGSVADVGGEHIVVGKFNVYSYEGGYKLTPVGAPIFNNFLAATGDLNSPAKLTVYTQWVPDINEVWLVYPADISTVPNKLLRMKLSTKAWSERFLADTTLASMAFLPVAVVLWPTAVGNWNDPRWTLTWGSTSFTKNAASILLCPSGAGGGTRQLMLYDYSTPTDNGVVIPWSVTTKQLGDGRQYNRWERAVILAQGNGVKVEFSQDTGLTWTTLGTLNFGTTDVSVKQQHIDTVSTSLMLRLRGTDPTFDLRYIDIDAVAESEW